MTKPKVNLAQLNAVNIEKETIPLACGYLKALAYATGLCIKVDIEILTKRMNSAGDASIVSSIVKRQPSIVGFSCYVWNTERTLYIINEIKARMPHVIILCGGSEASLQYKKIMRNKNIDIVIIGEGEYTFVEVLRNFLFNAPRLDDIPGIVFRKKKTLIVTPKREQVPDINIIPSPYLLGFINPKEYGFIMIESYRGCIEKCTYCNWRRHAQGIRYFHAERIKKEMLLARQQNVKVLIKDTIFNLPKIYFGLVRL